MKKSALFLLPCLIASCTMTPPQSPYKAGTTFTLNGVTKYKQAVQRSIILRNDGVLVSDRWDYDADGLSVGSMSLSISNDFSVILVLGNLNEITKSQFTCILRPDLSTPNWKQATGALISGTFDEMSKMVSDAGKAGSRNAFIQSLKDNGGDCTLTR